MDDEKIINLYWQRNEMAIEASRQKYGALCRSVAGRILPDERDGAADFREVLNGFLGALMPEARAFFVRRYWYGESIREIAESCGAGESKVKSSLMRTRNSLRDVLEREGVNL